MTKTGVSKGGLMSRINILPEKERNRILYEFNDTLTDYPHDKTIQQLFEEQVAKTPEATAVVFDKEILTYDELNRASNQLAWALRNKGIKADEIVGVMVEPSPQLIIGILGILKAGGAYLPVDPEYPEARIKFMLADSGVKMLLTQSWLEAKELFAGEMINLDQREFAKEKTENLAVANNACDLAYVIYTSGSTGRPKGVMVEHRNMVNLALCQITKTYKLNEHDRILQTSPISFDPSMEQIFIALLSGAALYLIDSETLLSIDQFHEFLRANRITYLYHVPSFLKNANLKGLNDLRVVVSGGEACPIDLARRLCETFEFFNGYGPAEATVKSAMCLVTSEGIGASVPIGKPISNAKLYILKGENTLAPIGILGELCIAGAGVARGYLNRPELTAEKFTSNPFIPGERMYRTGDLARWLPDGNIEFLGRADNQVKIRGIRIEVGEIEKRLLELESINEAIVVAKEGQHGDKVLCAYLVMEKEIETAIIRKWVAAKLPNYMVPSFFVHLEKLPLTPSGKVDRQALPEPDNTHVEGSYVAPQGKVEETLARIWSEELGREKVGIYDNFFELGGHSLKATVVIAKIHKELNVRLPLKELFRTPTISGISEYLSGLKTSDYEAIESVAPKESYEASSAQKRMWLLQQFDHESIGYNMPGVLIMDGNLNRCRLEAAFSALIKRHDSLRTSFDIVATVVHQRVAWDVEFELEYTENSSEQLPIENIIKAFLRPFDLSQAPLLRVGLIKVSVNRHYLLFDMHHIISDGISMAILTREWIALYEGRELPEPRIGYKDFSQWQNEYLKSEKVKKQEAYWLEQFANEIPILQLPLDYPRPAVQNFAGASVDLRLSSEITAKVNNLARAADATLYMVLLSAVNILLAKYTSGDDIIIGSPIAGRPHADLEGIIGMFVNTLAMRNYPKNDKTYAEFLNEVKATAIKAYENQDYQFEELVDKLDLRRSLSHHPIFDVMFVLQNMEAREMTIPGLKITGYHTEQIAAKFDLTFTAVEVSGELLINISHPTCLFKQETIQRLSGHLQNIIAAITTDKDILLGNINMLSKAEQAKIVYEFNETQVDYPIAKTVIEVFEAQVKALPDQMAIVYENERLTYQELNDRANAVAHKLKSLGVKPNDCVALMAGSGPEMIIGMFGILKAGGAYVPLEPTAPEARVKYILEDCQPKVLLTDQEQVATKIPVVRIHELKEEALENLERVNQPDDLVYVIYTSGTTGNPKGVMIEQQNVLNLVNWQKAMGNYSETSVILQNSNYIFDASVLEIFPTLLSGCTLEIIPEETRLDLARLLQLIENKQLFMLPSMFKMLVDYAKENGLVAQLHKFDKLYLGGEALPYRLMETYKKLPGSQPENIFNLYGPTEITVYATSYCLNQNHGKTLIGKPLANTQAYILVGNKASGIGTVGELCIGGMGVARGYLNQPQLTAAKFVSNPFVEGERIYRTGDLARWLPDGNIEFLGRMDHQVKIRGFRIELGEIESCLLAFEKVKEAVVIATGTGNEGSDDQYLCAYVVTEKDPTMDEIKQHLANKLPDYMMPSFFVELEKMPLMENGKVDRKALPKPDGKRREYVPPRNATEEKLAQIWSVVLGREPIGINDDFFELGGHSLSATAVIAKIHKELNVKLSLKALFNAPTISGLSESLIGAEKSVYGTIEPAESKAYYEASSAQKRMWLLWLLDQQSTSYNLPAVLIMDGILDKSRLEQAVLGLIKRHELLRTTFALENDMIVQRVATTVEFEVEFTENTEANIKGAIKDFIRPFDLSWAPLLRVGLIKTGIKRHYLLFDMHHIIADGVSMSIVTKELMALYEGQKLAKQRIDYKDFSQWQNAYLKSEAVQKQENYWLEQFSEVPPLLDFPLDYPRSAKGDFAGESLEFRLNQELTEKLNHLARDRGATLYMVLLSVVNILLAKYTGQDDIIIGSPIAGRPHADLEGIIGMFVGTLAMRNHPTSDKTYGSFLNEVKETALAAYENQDYQFEELVEKLNLRRDLSRNPLFDVMFALQNIEVSKVAIEGLEVTSYKADQTPAKFDLTFTVIEMPEGLLFNITYRKSLFKRTTIQQLRGNLQELIEVITADNDVLLGDINVLSKEEQHKVLYEFNETFTEYPRDKTIHQLFEEQARKTPDKVALVFNEERMTYSELNLKANQVAHMLQRHGVSSDQVVGIMVERSSLMIIGILGILKSGGAYLPIDLEYPQERIKYMLEDSGARILLTQSWLSGKAKVSIKNINLDQVLCEKELGVTLETRSSPNDLAYVMYTSGSTGLPKGVMVEHGNVVNLALGQKNSFDINHNDRIVQISSISFDASVEQIFITLFSGATLYLIDKETLLDQFKFNEFMLNNRITHLHAVPSFLAWADLKGLNQLKRIIGGGEEFPAGLVKKLTSRSDIYNEYGPTETTITAIMSLVNPAEIDTTVPIGRPISNYQAYILNTDRKPLPIGVKGELYIGGAGVTRGYFNRPELTSERFIPNPFRKGERMYRTGDLARWLPDGNIEYLGRIDHQVKVRGFRIELGEVESQLLKLDVVKATVVLVKADSQGEKSLCAYVVLKEAVSTTELRLQLANHLPSYMIPTYFVKLDRLPLTANGKIDRQALPDPDSLSEQESYVLPRNQTEATLAKIWSEVLKKEGVGINDNFFDLGGHSLKAAAVISRIQKKLNVTVPVPEFFKMPTIMALSQYITNASASIYSAIEPAPVKEFYEASSAGKRMWLLQQFDLESTAYNMPGVLIIDGELSRTRLELAFSDLITRHEALRTSFAAFDDKVVQKISENVDFAIEFSETTEENITDVIKAFIRPFALNTAPLLRVSLVKTAENRHYLLTDMHHIISDGVSLSILRSEFIALYKGLELKNQRLQYKDFSHWQNEFLKSEKLLEQEQYWLEQFSDEIPVLNLPLDYTRPAVHSFAGDSVSFQLNRETTEKLRRLSKTSGATMYMILLSAISILLSKYSGQEDIIVGSPIAGRPHVDLEQIIGMFVNTLVMRNHPTRTKSYRKFLNEVKENALLAYENQDYQFEELVDKLDLRRDISRNPLFDVMFVLQNMEQTHLGIDGWQLATASNSQAPAKFDLTFTAVEANDKISLSIQYCTCLFKRETIKRLCFHLQRIIEVITTNKDVYLGDINLLTKEEQDQILYEFNDTDVEYLGVKTLHQLFVDQARKTPQNTALVYEGESLTYSQLNEQANGLAKRLRAKGIKPNQIVGIMAERSPAMIIGILGILKSGGAYLPIDPDDPEERISFMLKDSQAKILLTYLGSTREEKKLKGFDGEVIDLADAKLYEGQIADLDLVNSGCDLAYVIYTSGTTGKPKGVLIEHQSIVNTLSWRKDYYQFNDRDATLQLLTYTFDGSVVSIFTTLISGSKLVLIDQDQRLNIEYLKNTIIANQVTHFLITPSFYNNLLDSGLADVQTLRIIAVGGEQIPESTLRKHFQLFENVRMVNEYGPTENSVTSTVYELTAETTKILIGKPINNTRGYVVDENNKLLPIGIAGELALGGKGLARGYLRRDELTRAKFVANPFEKDQLMYRTGDLARFLPDGNIEFLGRMDHQVKIRGFRIEIGEIENQLRMLDGVDEAVVLAYEEGEGASYLCAYVVTEADISEGEFRQWLGQTFPEYMLPSFFVKLAAIPLTLNGKIDRRALPCPDSVLQQRSPVAPRNETEATLVKIWSEVLNRDRIGISDNFFDLGGHSLKATTIINRINTEMGISIPLAVLYRNPYISQIAEYINLIKGKASKNVEGLILLRENSQTNKNLFLIHSSSGRAEEYIKLVNQLDEQFTYWGINYEGQNPSGSFPPIAELARQYVKKIKQVQQEGPYYISGWSLGGIIAFEMARQLEMGHDELKFIGLYDAPAINDAKLKIFDNSNWQDETKAELKAKISYFIATKTKDEAGDRVRSWQQQGNIDFYPIDATHFSMFEDDVDIKKLALTLSEVLNRLLAAHGDGAT